MEEISYTWGRPKSAGVPHGIYLPSVVNEGIGEINLVMDSSSSMDDRRYLAGLVEIKSIINTLAPAETNVIYADTKILKIEEFEEGVEFDDNKRYGHGGTCFNSSFKWIEENSEDNCAIIVVSDMEFFEPGDLGVPTLWVDVGCGMYRDPSYGKVVRVMLDD